MTDELTLGVVVPTTITDTILHSSTVNENDYAAWNSGTTYSTGQRVISTTTHRIYESAQNTNLNKDPTNINNRVGTSIWWIDVSPTNKWAMFDDMNSTKTTVATPLTVVLRPGFISALYMAGLEAENISVTVRDAPLGNIVFTYSASLENSQPPDYWEHFFMPFRQQPDIFIKDIPPYYNAEITITLSSTTGNVSCGTCVVGDPRFLGMTKWGAEAQPKTYSSITEDAYGVTTIKRRSSSKNVNLTAYVEPVDADYAEETIRLLLDTPCLWVGVDQSNYSSLRVFGLGSGTINYESYGQCVLNLTVKGFV